MHSRYRYGPGTPNGFVPATTRRIATEDPARGESFFMPGYGCGGFNHDPGRGVVAKDSRGIFLERKEDLFMEAGRLAAEYMVAHGLLPAGALYPESRHSPSRHSQQHTRGRVSALARLGNVVPDYTTAKRRHAAVDHGSPNGARASSSKGRKRSRSSRRSNSNRSVGNAWWADRDPRLQQETEHGDKEEDTGVVKDSSDGTVGQNSSGTETLLTEKERSYEDESKKETVEDHEATKKKGGSESPATADEHVEAVNLPIAEHVQQDTEWRNPPTSMELFKMYDMNAEMNQDGKQEMKTGRDNAMGEEEGEEEDSNSRIPKRSSELQSGFASSSSLASDADLLQGILDSEEDPKFSSLSFEAFMKIIGE